MKNTFPKTRYQGSKYKLRDWIKENLKDLNFQTVLDGFSGTSSVSYLFKEMNKDVFSNDIMPCNYWISKALIENSNETINNEDLSFLTQKDSNFIYNDFIQRTFNDVYFTDDENIWLDIVIQNILRLNNESKKALALWALFQSCIIKRPYNLFHRKNLYVRMADVERSFGNKVTWDKSFIHFFNLFVNEGNKAIFNNGRNNKSICSDILTLNVDKVDLVYLDPPYIPQKGTLTMYNEFYHFLNGLVNYHTWDSLIDYKTKNLRIKSEYSIWEDKKKITTAFENIIEKYKQSKIVISYRQDGIPTIEKIKEILIKNEKNVEIKTIDYRYALAKNTSKEILIIAT